MLFFKNLEIVFSLKKLEGNIYFLFGIWKKTETLEPTHVMPQTQWENTKKTSTFKVPLLIRIHSVFLIFPTQTQKSMDFFTFIGRAWDMKKSPLDLFSRGSDILWPIYEVKFYISPILGITRQLLI